MAGLNPIPVPATASAETRVFVLPRPGETPGSSEIAFRLEAVDGSLRPLVRRARYLAPGGNGAH